MAIAKQCDRCHNLYMPYHVSRRKEKVNGLNIVDRNDDNTTYYNRYYFDLCPDCMGSFFKWLDEFVENKNGGER